MSARLTALLIVLALLPGCSGPSFHKDGVLPEAVRADQQRCDTLASEKFPLKIVVEPDREFDCSDPAVQVAGCFDPFSGKRSPVTTVVKPGKWRDENMRSRHAELRACMQARGYREGLWSRLNH